MEVSITASLKENRDYWPPCDELNPAIIKLKQDTRILRCENETIIFSAVSELKNLYMIESGTIALFAEMGGRKTSISEIVFEGDMFGFAASRRHDCSAMALSNVILRAYSIDLVLDAQKASIDFSTLLLQKQLERLKKNQRQIHRVSRLNALNAVMDYIHELATMHTGELNEGQVVPLPLNRFKTADYLGLTFETVSRSFSKLKKMGLIDFSDAQSITVKQCFKTSISAN